MENNLYRPALKIINLFYLDIIFKYLILPIKKERMSCANGIHWEGEKYRVITNTLLDFK